MTSETMRMNISDVKHKSTLVLKHVRNVDVPTKAASVAYFAMLASIPLLAVVITLSAQLLPDLSSLSSVGVGDLTTGELNKALTRLLPTEANEILLKEIARLQSKPPVGLLSVGLLLSLWTASRAQVAVINAMYDIYDESNDLPFWKIQWRAVAMTLLFSGILMAALVLIVAIPAVINFFNLDYFAGSLMRLAQWLVLLGIVMAGFEMTYRFGPKKKLLARHITRGTVIGASVFVVVSVIFQIYVQRFGSYSAVYGSLGGAVIFMVWIWMLSTCMLGGCAINKVLEDEERRVQARRVRDLARVGGWDDE